MAFHLAIMTSLTHLKDIGQTANNQQSAKVLTWSDNQGNSGSVRPYVVPAFPINLWHHNLLSQMGIMMYSPNEVVTQQMMRQWFWPWQGLGKFSQGITEPIHIVKNPGPMGLGMKNIPWWPLTFLQHMQIQLLRKKRCPHVGCSMAIIPWNIGCCYSGTTWCRPYWTYHLILEHPYPSD